MINKIKIKREEVKNEINLFAKSMIKEFNLKDVYELSKINTLLNRIDKLIGDIELEIITNNNKEVGNKNE